MKSTHIPKGRRLHVPLLPGSHQELQERNQRQRQERYPGRLPTESKICVPYEGNQPTTTGAEAGEEGNASWNPQEAGRTGAHVGDNPWDSAGAGWGGHGDL